MMNQDRSIILVQEYLATAKQIAIIPHRNPDGDALGSALGLWHVLQKTGHHVKVISPNEFPDFLAWMPGTAEVLIFERDKDTATAYLKDADLIFTLDFNALHRTGEQMETCLQQLSAPMIMVDHHQMPDNYAAVMFSDTHYGSTCELLYNCLVKAGFSNDIDKEAATCLYTGIVTDSGSFRFPKTTGNTHRVVADLIDKGVDNPMVHNHLFNTSSYNRLQLLGRALENLTVLPEYQVAYTTLSQRDLYEFNYQKGDTEGIVNYGLSIKNIHLAAIFIENKDEGIIKISFRSEGSVNVNEFARKYFNGGGHINAAGGKSFASLHTTVEEFINIVKKEKQNEVIS